MDHLDSHELTCQIMAENYDAVGFDEVLEEDPRIAEIVLVAFSALNQEEIILPEFIPKDIRLALCTKAIECGFDCNSKTIGTQNIEYIAKARTGKELIGCINLSTTSELAARTLLEKYPLISEDILEGRFRRVGYETASTSIKQLVFPENNNSSICKLAVSPTPKIPPLNGPNQFRTHRESLPIWKYRENILQTIQGNQIVLIKGDSGVGKSTQIPQFILDNAYEKKRRVRIISCLPKKVAVLAISERVAAERGEKVGNTVGYQVKLESRVSPCDTILTYCTSGILLRSLSNVDYGVLKNTTHLILDEAHVRDRFTDLILASLKDILRHFPLLHLVIVGSDEQLDKIAFYLGIANCYHLYIPGFSFEVKTKFLDEVLEFTNFQNSNYKGSNAISENESSGKWSRIDGTNGFQAKPKLEGGNELKTQYSFDEVLFPAEGEIERLDIDYADDLIAKVYTGKDGKLFNEFIDLIVRSEVSVNYQTTKVGVTMLMASAAIGSLEQVKELMKLGADPRLRSFNGESAQDIAKTFGNSIVFNYLTSVLQNDPGSNWLDSRERLLKNYLRDDDEELDRIDLRLILSLIHKIHSTHATHEGILVFLPGYEEIVSLKQMLFCDDEYQLRNNSFVLYLLHPNTQNDQRSMFLIPRSGVRKILLATNVAENSLTFEDVVHVIDSGKEREKINDSSTAVGFSRFKYSWISKSSALQRKGRVGRCQTGYHFSLYSVKQFDMMNLLSTPELLKCSIQELCLQSKELISTSVKIREFFSRLPEPPLSTTVDDAVAVLISLGALDDDEELTSLGTHLLDFPIEPRLAKALLYSVGLKCVDPILTIVSTLAFRDPFEIPDDLYDRKKSFQTRRVFSHNTFSDHVALLKAFQEWEQIKGSGSETGDESGNLFCSQNYISSATFEMIYGIRSQLLAQLRASGFVRCKGPSDVRDLNRHSDNWAIVKAALLAALYPNIAKIDKNTSTITNGIDHKIHLHQSSTLVEHSRFGVSSIPSEWVLYDEIINLESFSYIRGCTVVSAAVLALFGGTSRLEPDVEPVNYGTSDMRPWTAANPNHVTKAQLRINGWIALVGSCQQIQLIYELRAKFYSLIERQLRKPGVSLSSCEENVLSTILLILTSEDQQSGLIQTNGIGQWPKFAGGNLLSAPRFGFEKPDRLETEFVSTKPISYKLGLPNYSDSCGDFEYS